MDREETRGLQCVGSQRVRQNWACMHIVYICNDTSIYFLKRIKKKYPDLYNERLKEYGGD